MGKISNIFLINLKIYDTFFTIRGCKKKNISKTSY